MTPLNSGWWRFSHPTWLFPSRQQWPCWVKWLTMINGISRDDWAFRFTDVIPAATRVWYMQVSTHTHKQTHASTHTHSESFGLHVCCVRARVLRTRTCAAYAHMWACINSSVHFLVRWVMNTYSMRCVVGPIFFICAVFQSALMRAYVSVYFIGSINHRSRAHSLPLLDQKSPLKLSVSMLYKLMLVWW